MSGSDYTTTPNLGLFKPNYSKDVGNWGNHLNTNADVLDAAIGTGGPFLPLTGGTLGDGTDAPVLIFNGAAGTAKGLHWQTGGQYRWRFQTDASDNLGLYAYDAGGVFKGTTLLAVNDGSALQINAQPQVTYSTATPFQQTVGLYHNATNTGAAAAQGAKFGYFSSAGNSGFDTGLTNIAIFDPVFVAGQAPFYQSVWLVAVSPNDTVHGWSTIIGELNITNRGNDTGWMRDRTMTTNTGGFLFVPEVATFGGTEGGEGKNATFAMSVGHSGASNSTGFPAKFYNGLLFEPNAIVGLTGRAIYATGDITGTASQYPYGPLQTEGTWLHGIDHTIAVYEDTHAETMLVGQGLAWITGTTASPTAVASVGASGSGANLSIVFKPAGTGTVHMTGLPTSAAGLVAGDVWRNGNVLNIV